MFNMRSVTIVASGLVCALLLIDSTAASQEANKNFVDDDGTLHVHGEVIPYSDLASSELKSHFIEQSHFGDKLAQAYTNSSIASSGEEAMEEFINQGMMIPGIERLRKAFPVDILPGTFAGVKASVITPQGGVSRGNSHRILINLHGGGMEGHDHFAILAGQEESIAIASIGGIKVVAVNYREGPEWHFPAASVDVAKVYRELLKTYRPENIGIFGCSSGAELTGESMAWFQTHGLPRPGAIGMFGEGAILGRFGDSSYLFTGGEPSFTKASFDESHPYYRGVDWNDPLASPASHPSILGKFPPSLLISGTRDIGLSPVVYTHSRLIDLGVEAELHIWEGAMHCSYAQGLIHPDAPETRQAWKVIAQFFDKHLGREAK
jgi:epsilon-lactone hydrolase